MAILFFFFFNDTATTEIYTLSLHDALPICLDLVENRFVGMKSRGMYETPGGTILHLAHRGIESITLDRGAAHLKDELMPKYADRKSTRLNSSHANISYAVFCLKKKKNHDLE